MLNRILICILAVAACLQGSAFLNHLKTVERESAKIVAETADLCEKVSDLESIVKGEGWVCKESESGYLEFSQRKPLTKKVSDLWDRVLALENNFNLTYVPESTENTTTPAHYQEKRNLPDGVWDVNITVSSPLTGGKRAH